MISWLLISCGENGMDESSFYSDTFIQDIPEGEPITYNQLRTLVLNRWDCLTCHGPGGGNSWGADQDAIEQNIIDNKIVPGNPEASSLYTRSRGTIPNTMPPSYHTGPAGPGPVDAQGLEYIERFINGLP